jgi:Flp pilus assembly CpaF family ATPase
MMAADDMVRGGDSRRFADLVKLQGVGSRFIDREQERRLLEEGVTKFGLTLDEARGVLRSVAEDNGYVFESEAGRRVEQVMSRHAGKRGLISRRQFRATAQVLRDFSDNAITEPEARRRIKQIMVDNGWRPRRAGLLRTRRWYRQVQL